MRYLLVLLSMLLFPVPATQAQISIGIGIGLPGIDIGINLPAYPRLVRVPGYPVYYAPQADVNIFFYDGLYWVYEDDSWYASSWYNGPWEVVEPEYMPLFVLRVPVRYYRRPPVYFRYWRADRPPRWGEHWGHDWERRRSGWDRWDRRSAPPPAPLPSYQREYSGNRYPRSVEQQRRIHSENYRYRPRESVTPQHFQPRDTPDRSRSEPRQQAPGMERAPSHQQRPPQDQPGRSRSEPRQQAPDMERAPSYQQRQPQDQSGRSRTEPRREAPDEQRAPGQQQWPSYQQRQPQEQPGRSRAEPRQQVPDEQRAPGQQPNERRQQERRKPLPQDMERPQTEQ